MPRNGKDCFKKDKKQYKTLRRYLWEPRFVNPKEMETKAKFGSQVNSIINNRKFIKKKAEEIFGTTQSRVSSLALGGL